MQECCQITKTCMICWRRRHNLAFYSNSKGRTAIKPYCKYCEPIYTGIQKGLISRKIYQGLDFNTNQLTGDTTGRVTLLYKKAFKKLPTLDAIPLVKQGGAHVTSPATIESLTERLLRKTDLRTFVLNRDKHQCHYCGGPASTLDHIIPKSKGGLNTPLNLVACCKGCNLLKDSFSKKQFLYKLHHDPGRLHENKNAVHQKKCTICQLNRPLNKFGASKNYCLDCSKFLPSFQLGYLTTREIAAHHENTLLLDTELVVVYDNNKEVINNIRQGRAENLVSRGMAKIINKSSIQLLFNNHQLKRLFPDVGNPLSFLEQPTEDKIRKMTPGNTIGVYDKSKNHIMGIKKTTARRLIKQGEATVMNKNRIKLTIHNDTFFKDHPELYPTFKNTANHINHGCYPLEKVRGFTIPAPLSDHMVKTGLAVSTYPHQIKLTSELDQILLQLPTLAPFLKHEHRLLLSRDEIHSNHKQTEEFVPQS